jgi:uncharacterized protein YndB with AHSA1/START domain
VSYSHLYVIYIGAQPAAIWKAITEADWTRRYYFGVEVHSEFQRGSRVEWTRQDGQLQAVGEILEVNPPSRLHYTWMYKFDADAGNDPPTRIAWDIKGVSDRTSRLTFLHGDFPTQTKTYRATSTGWPFILSNLKTLLETGEALYVDTPDPSSW